MSDDERSADPHDVRPGDEVAVLRQLLSSDNEQVRLHAATALLRHRDAVLETQRGEGGPPAITVFAPQAQPPVEGD